MGFVSYLEQGIRIWGLEKKWVLVTTDEEDEENSNPLLCTSKHLFAYEERRKEEEKEGKWRETMERKGVLPDMGKGL